MEGAGPGGSKAGEEALPPPWRHLQDFFERLMGARCHARAFRYRMAFFKSSTPRASLEQ